MKLRIVTHVEHPELRGKLPDLWPEFMHHDETVSSFWPQLYEVYPDPRLLELSSAPVTFASDAHEPALVGEDFDDAIALARASGRETVSVFEARVRRQEPIG